MAKMIIDTCTWLELAKLRAMPIFDKLIEWEEQAENLLLTNPIIIEEWDRNRERIIGEVVQSIREVAKSALKLSELIGNEDGEALAAIIEKYRDVQELQIELANRHIDKVESLLKTSDQISIKDNVKIFVTDRALTGLAPFHNKKNNIADALIYFSSIDFIRRKYRIASDLIFVSANHKEFCAPGDQTSLHPDLVEASRGVNMYFFNNIAEALDLSPELVDEFIEWQLEDWIETQAEIARGK